MYIVIEVGKKSVPLFEIDFQAVIVQYCAVLSYFCHIIIIFFFLLFNFNNFLQDCILFI